MGRGGGEVRVLEHTYIYMHTIYAEPEMKDGRTGQGAGTQKTRKKERKEIQKQS